MKPVDFIMLRRVTGFDAYGIAPLGEFFFTFALKSNLVTFSEECMRLGVGFSC